MTNPLRIRRLNHAVLFVSDVDRAASFYQGILGFEVVQKVAAANAVFLRASASDNHHDLGLFGLGAQAGPAGRGHTGLYHLAWQVDTIDELAHARALLLESGALVGESSHGATKSVYAKDPDGNELEIMWMLPRADWGVYEDQAVVEPLALDAEIAKWSGRSTADELVTR